MINVKVVGVIEVSAIYSAKAKSCRKISPLMISSFFGNSTSKAIITVYSHHLFLFLFFFSSPELGNVSWG